MSPFNEVDRAQRDKKYLFFEVEIQNRLKVSKVIYYDSQFKNSKYEGNHLLNTF